MQATIDTFDERTSEITLYYDALTSLYEGKAEDDENKKFFDDDFLKILKSNALLMIYNLVESTIMGGILEIYDELCQRGVSSQVYDKKAHFNSYREKAIEIINAILSEDTIIMDRKATDISGNLDAEKIRQVCNEHGIVYQVDPGCRGGFVLTDVKEKRNNLAHGTISFVECGRNYSIEDLEKIKNETILFLQGILSGMEDYYNNQRYLYVSN